MVRDSSERRVTKVGHASRVSGSGTLFGVPMGDLGWFTSLLMGVAIGFAAFFLATFLAIIGFLTYSTATHRAVDFARTYTRVGLPVGVLVMIVALGYLGSLWVRRKLRRA